MEAPGSVAANAAPAPAPDLEIQAGGISLSITEPEVGSTVTVTALIRNTGAAATTVASLQLTDILAGSGSAVASQQFPSALQSIAPQGSRSFQHTRTIVGPAGIHLFCVEITGVAPAERRVFNNRACRAIKVQPSVAAGAAAHNMALVDPQAAAALPAAPSSSPIPVAGETNQLRAGPSSEGARPALVPGGAAADAVQTLESILFYTATFEQPIGAEWSNGIPSQAPNGRHFLGEFGGANQSAALSLGNLPAHTEVEVAFELFIIRSWDGDGAPVCCPGPDRWSLRVDGGPTLLDTTFSNGTLATQSYPTANQPGRTGAAENNMLGFLYQGSPADSVYRLRFAFPHTGAGPLTLRFSSTGLQALTDESWGLDNVEVRVINRGSDLSLAPDDLSVSPTAPSIGANVAVNAAIRNTGTITVTQATVVLTETVAGGTVLRTESIALNTPIVPWGVAQVPFPARAAGGPAGLHTICVTVWAQATSPSGVLDTTLDNNSACKSLNVIDPALPLRRLELDVQDLETWQGANASLIAVVRNTGTAPVAITGATVATASVATFTRLSPLPIPALAPGDTAQLSFAVAVPTAIPGATFPISQQIALVVSTSTGVTVDDTFTLTIEEEAPTTLSVAVVDAANNGILPNALVMIDGDEHVYQTDADGWVDIPAKPGNPYVFVYQPGYIAWADRVIIREGASNELIVLLNQGNTFEITDVQATPLTPVQLAERGINLADPVNFWVYDFTIYLSLNPITIPNVTLPRAPAAGTHVDIPAVPIGSGGGGPASGFVFGQFYYVSPTERVEMWIIIPGRFRILKQFWEAAIFLKNQASAGVTIRDVQATLTTSPVPGMSLPDLNNQPQPAMQTIDTIPGGESRSLSWIVRGGATGAYQLGAKVSGDLYFGTSQKPAVHLDMIARPATVIVYEPTLDVTYTVPSVVTAGVPFTLHIDVINTTPIAIHEVTVEIDQERMVNAFLLPGEADRKLVGMGVLAPGGHATVTFQIVPELSGCVNMLESFMLADPHITPHLNFTPSQCGGLLGVSSCRIGNLEFSPGGGFTLGEFDFGKRLTELGDGDLQLLRSYNSADLTGGRFGMGWRSNLDMGLQQLTNGSVAVTMADGRLTRFANVAGSYQALGGANARLTLSGGTYTLSTPQHTEYLFNSTGRLTSIRTPANTLTLLYNTTTGNLQSVSDRFGRTINLTAANGRITAISEGAATYRYEYDGANRLTRITDPRGHAVRYGYTDGLLSHRYDQNGNLILQNVYDGNQRLARQVRYGGGDLSADSTVTFDYVSQPGSIRVTQNGGAPTTIFIDPHSGQPTGSIDALGYRRDYTLNGEGDPTAVTGPNGVTTYAAYDAMGLPTAISTTVTVDGAQQSLVSRMTYDQNSDLTSLIDPRGATTSYAYSYPGKPSRMTDPLGQITNYTYDTQRRLTRTTLPNGLALVYSYNAQGRLSQVEKTYRSLTPPASGTGLPTWTQRTERVSFTYNAQGLLTFRSDPYRPGWTPAGVTYTYDSVGNLVEIVNQLGQRATAVYDPVGNVIERTDFNGRRTRYGYDWQRRLISVIESSADGDRITYYRYDANGNLSTVDSNSIVTTYTYDRLNRLVLTSVPLRDGGTDRKENLYDAAGNVSTTIRYNDRGSSDQVTLFEYDEQNRLVRTTAGAGIYNYQTLRTYDQSGNLIRVRKSKAGPPANWNDPALTTATTTTYDLLDRPLSVTTDAWDPATGARSLTTTYSYTDTLNLRTAVDPSGIAVTIEEDPAGRPVISTLRPSARAGVQPGAQLQISYAAYDQRNMLIYIRDAVGGRQDFAHDGLGRLISHSIRDSSSALSTNVYYTGTTRPTITTIGPAPHYQRHDASFDEFGQLVSETSYTGPPVSYPQLPTGALTTSYGYDYHGNRTMVVEPNGRTTWYNYENNGALTTTLQSVTMPGQGVYTVRTSSTYDSVGNPLSTTNPNNQTFTAAYDALGRLVGSADPLDNVVSMRYDGLDRLVEHRDARNVRSLYTYDNASRLLSISNGGSLGNGRDTLTNFTYGTGASPLTMTHWPSTGSSTTTSYSYDGLDRAVETASPQGLVRYGYDNLDRVVSLTFGPSAADLRQIRYLYDTKGRLGGIRNWREQQLNYTYSGERLAGMSYPNGVTAEYGYDGAGRLTSLRHRSATATLYDASYTLDTLGRTVALRETQNQDTRQNRYAYDDLNRLLEEAIQLNATQTLTNTYRYDLAGNRLSKVTTYQGSPSVGTTTYQYDAANRLISRDSTISPAPRQTSTYTYDANGNLLAEQVSSQGTIAHTTSYGYDSRNRLASWQQAAPTWSRSATFQYDGADSRVAMSFNGANTTYLAAGSTVLQERPAGQPATSLLSAPGASAPLFRAAGTAEGEWYHHDALGNARVLSNAAGTGLNTQIFDTFGVLLAATWDVPNNRLFGGMQFDPTGLYYTGCGYYDPQDARAIGGCGEHAGVPASAEPSASPSAGAPPLFAQPGNGRDANQANSFGQRMSQYRRIAYGPLGASGPDGRVDNNACFVSCRHDITLIKAPERPPRDHALSDQARELSEQIVNFLNDHVEWISLASDLLLPWPANSLFQAALPHGIAEIEQFLRSSDGQQLLTYSLMAAEMAPTLISLALDFMPVVGQVKGIGEAILGYDLITEEKLEGWERALNLVPLAGLFDEIASFSRSTNRMLNNADDAADLFGSVSRHSDDLEDLARHGDDFSDLARHGDDLGAAARHGDDFSNLARHGGTCLNSFSADTPVATSTGDVPIAEIEIGDQVLAYDEASGSTGSYAVTAVIAHVDLVVMTVTIDGEPIETTPEHPFYVLLRGWVHAEDLRAGDQVRNAAGSYGRVQAIVTAYQPQPMYNLSVADAHTFFVGDGDWLVHNCKTTVLGKSRDIDDFMKSAEYQANPQNYNILRVKNWDWNDNVRFLRHARDEGHTFLLVSNPRDPLRRTGIFAKELEQMRAWRYVPKHINGRWYMIPR